MRREAESTVAGVRGAAARRPAPTMPTPQMGVAGRPAWGADSSPPPQPTPKQPKASTRLSQLRRSAASPNNASAACATLWMSCCSSSFRAMATMTMRFNFGSCLHTRSTRTKARAKSWKPTGNVGESMSAAVWSSDGDSSLWNQSCPSACTAVHRSSTWGFNNFDTRSLASFETPCHAAPEKSGGLPLQMSCKHASGSSPKGNSPESMTYKETPQLQRSDTARMSAAPSPPLPTLQWWLSTSGAIYGKLPGISPSLKLGQAPLLALLLWLSNVPDNDPDKCAGLMLVAMPKSASLIVGNSSSACSRRKFSGFTSRCTTPLSWQYASALSIWCANAHAVGSSRCPSS
mmetsp:Transcript_17163/g.49017  ORF Transcript_17163/g.49017 Transcript_17163/m.49017 type:complete len:346 (+) Transcript_17163:1019-2056(+)